jgi:hypothetical protein
VPTTPAKKARSLEEYADLFVALRDLGVESVAIGGCAVGAYAHFIGESVVSADLGLLVDPCDLLANKLAVDRPKDRPHVPILTRFLEEEVVSAFERERDPRERLAPATRLLATLGSEQLGADLASRLVALAQTAADWRFLAHRVPTRELADAVRAAPKPATLAAEVDAIVSRRRFASTRR